MKVFSCLVVSSTIPRVFTSPTQSPTISSTCEEYGSCLNNPDFEISLGRGCQWIRNKEERRVEICESDDVVREECPQTCGLCCENDPDYEFFADNGDVKDCEWIEKKEGRTRYCPTFNNGEMVQNMCPVACNFCQVFVPPIDAPTPPPICQPAPPPQICMDNPSYNIEGIENGCLWLREEEDRRISYCQNADVRQNCEYSCGDCCEDNPFFTFEKNNGRTGTCFWLSGNDNRVDRYCSTFTSEGVAIADMCPVTCQNCQELVPTSNPTTAPTTSFPTRVPAPPLSFQAEIGTVDNDTGISYPSTTEAKITIPVHSSNRSYTSRLLEANTCTNPLSTIDLEILFIESSNIVASDDGFIDVDIVVNVDKSRIVETSIWVDEKDEQEVGGTFRFCLEYSLIDSIGTVVISEKKIFNIEVRFVTEFPNVSVELRST